MINMYCTGTEMCEFFKILYLTCNAFVIVSVGIFKLLVEIVADFDILEHPGQLIHVISRHAHFLKIISCIHLIAVLLCSSSSRLLF